MAFSDKVTFNAMPDVKLACPAYSQLI